jgi:hypothetical protein
VSESDGGRLKKGGTMSVLFGAAFALLILFAATEDPDERRRRSGSGIITGRVVEIIPGKSLVMADNTALRTILLTSHTDYLDIESRPLDPAAISPGTRVTVVFHLESGGIRTADRVRITGVPDV